MPGNFAKMNQGRRNDEGILTPSRSPRKEIPVLVLRRSTRKRSMPLEVGAIFATPPPSAKKLKYRKKDTTSFASSPPTLVPTLTTLPYVVTMKLLLYLDVDSLERLSATCSYFDQMIAGQFLTSIEFPFHTDFSAEVAATQTFEKKPLLKIKCKKSKDEFTIFPHMPSEFSEPSSIHKIIVDNCPDMMDYLVHSLLSLLSLNQLREVDLVPDTIGDGWSRYPHQRVLDSYFNFDMGLLRQISRMGSLSHVTRLDVFVDHHFYLEEFMTKFPSLLELGLTIVSRSGLSKNAYLNEYLPRLASVVAASKAPVLKLNVVHESKRQISKVLKNSFVEKLVVVGPCTMNLVPVMDKLKEVEVRPDSVAPTSCTYWKSKQDDRTLHRAGLCCVNIGNLYKNCPKLEKFSGVDVGSIPQQPSFTKWNLRIKKKFYQLYLSQGGSMEFKPWAKARWFARKPVVQPVQVEEQVVNV